MKNKLINTIILLILMILLTVIAYASVTTANDRKSAKLPWQGTPTGYHDPAHNVGVNNIADPRFTLVSGTVGNGGSGVILDSTTGLYWMSDGYVAGVVNWNAAKTYCDTLILGGNIEWRMPNIKELNSIIDLHNGSPNISFFTSANTYYRSSTIVSNIVTSAWVVSSNGSSTNSLGSKTGYTNYIRCVR